jgi:hypothetical protein
MRPLHLHGGRRYDPDRLLEIDLFPARLTELTRTDEQQRRELQRKLRGQLPVVAFNGAQQLAEFVRFGDRGTMSNPRRHERATEIDRDITAGAAGRDRIAEDHAGHCAQSTRSRNGRAARTAAGHAATLER